MNSRPSSAAPTSGKIPPETAIATSSCASTFRRSRTPWTPSNITSKSIVNWWSGTLWSGTRTCFPRRRGVTSARRVRSTASSTSCSCTPATTGIRLYVLIDELRQLRQHRAGLSRGRGLPVLHSRRRILPQLLRHPQGRGREEPRRPGAHVHHRGVADHDGRRHQRFQHRPQHQPAAGVQRYAGLHRRGGAGPAGDVPGPRGVRSGRGSRAGGDGGVVQTVIVSPRTSRATSTTPTWFSTSSWSPCPTNRCRTS